MALRPPLTLDGTGQTQQLQAGDDVAIPANARLDVLELKFNLLAQSLVDQGFILPDEITQDL